MSESLIKRTKRKANFTILGNHIFKSSMSAEAIGVLTFILHLPDDWVLRKNHLQKRFNMGRDKMSRIFKELRDNGYLADLVRVNGKGGKFEGSHYIVYDEPETSVLETGSLKNRQSVNQCPGKPTSTKNYIDKELIELNTNTQRTNSTKEETLHNFNYQRYSHPDMYDFDKIFE